MHFALCGILLCAILESIELGVKTSLGHQLSVGPHLPDPPFMKDHNPVSVLDGGKTMGNDEGGPPSA
jgi:hypothetical protein